jgi:pimeloyl-ACP methyl ester carboxylesterase
MKAFITKSIGAGLNTLAHIAPARTARIGFELFCSPFRVPINEKQKAFLNTATQQTFNHKGNKIQTYRWGNGEKKILLLHGWQSHTYRWKIYVEALSKDHTVYTLDAPGHGLSGGKLLNVPLYSEVIEEQLRRMESTDTIITHSLGGFATFYTFYRNPELHANKIITLASPGEAQEFFDFYKRSLRLSKKTSQLIVNRFEETFQKTPEFFSAPVFASSLKIPGLIIHDVEDSETPFHHAERIHRAWKNSKLIRTKGFGHNLKSQEVVKEVIQFVNDPLSRHFNSNSVHAINHQ